MATPFVAEIRAVAFNFAPTGWAECNGQLMPISQNTALFSLIGTFYGGDGKSTFALPDLQGQAAVSQGQGAGLSTYFLGQQSGTESVTLLQSEIPLHTHTVRAVPDPADQTNPGPTRSLARSAPANAYQSTTNSSLKQMAFESLAAVGGSLPHNNMPPVLVMKFVIALQGVFPQRP